MDLLLDMIRWGSVMVIAIVLLLAILIPIGFVIFCIAIAIKIRANPFTEAGRQRWIDWDEENPLPENFGEDDYDDGDFYDFT